MKKTKTLIERRREQEALDQFSELKQFRENLILLLQRTQKGERYAGFPAEQKARITKNIDTLQHNPFLNELFADGKVTASLAQLAKADALLSPLSKTHFVADRGWNESREGKLK